MIYNGASGRAGVSKPSSLGGGSKNPELLASMIQRVQATGLFVCMTVQLLLCYIISIFYAVPIWRSASISSTVFRDWAVQTKPRGFLAKWSGMDVAWQNYISSVLLPLLSALCTAPEEDVMNHPMEEILGTLSRTYQFLHQN
jgi:microfibrillar-associated protein 1